MVSMVTHRGVGWMDPDIHRALQGSDLRRPDGRFADGPEGNPEGGSL